MDRIFHINGDREEAFLSLIQRDEDKESDGLNWERPFRRMQLFLRPFIALLDVIEKQRTDGITYSNLKRNFEEYCDFLKVEHCFPSAEYKDKYYSYESETQVTDRKRIQTLLVDYYNNVGSILFYKNKNFMRLHLFAFESMLKEEIELTHFDQYAEHFAQKELPLTQGDSSHIKEENLNCTSTASNLYSFVKYMCLDEEETPKPDKSLLSLYTPSLSAYVYYRLSIKEFVLPYRENLRFIRFPVVQPLFEEGVPNDLTLVTLFLFNESNVILNSTQYFVLANLVNKLGDAILAIISKYSLGKLEQNTIDLFLMEDNEELLEQIIDFFDQKLDADAPVDAKDFFCINLPLYLYRVAGLLYAKADRTYSQVFQHKKFLYILKEVLTLEKANKKELVKLIAEHPQNQKDRKAPTNVIEKIGLKIIKGNTAISGISNRAQILKYRDILEADHAYDFTAHIYSGLTTAPEVREVLLLVEEIKLKIWRRQSNPPLFKPCSILHPYDVVSSMFERMLELKYQSEYDYYVVHQLFDIQNEEKLSPNSLKFVLELAQLRLHSELDSSKKDQEATLRRCICNALFSLREIIRSLNTNGVNYITNYSFLANAHYKLANWCLIYRKYKTLTNNQEIDRELQKLIGTKNIILLEPYYHYNIAHQMFNHALAMHAEGKSYKNVNADMHFLDDDYNDNLTHYCAANERFRINLGMIGDKIKDLEEILQSSRLNQYGNYLHNQTGAVKVESIWEKLGGWLLDKDNWEAIVDFAGRLHDIINQNRQSPIIQSIRQYKASISAIKRTKENEVINPDDIEDLHKAIQILLLQKIESDTSQVVAKKCKNLIATNKVEEAIALFKSYFDADPHHQEILILENRWNQLKEEKRKGKIIEESHLTRRTGLVDSFLSLLNEVVKIKL